MLLLCARSCGHAAAAADSLEDAEKLYRTGQYDQCAEQVDEETKNNGWNEPWRQLKIRTELARGKYAEAMAAAEGGLRRFPASVGLHLLAYEVYRKSGREQEAAGELDTIERLFQGWPRRYATAPGLVTLGRYFLLRGADARKVLDQFYDVVIKQQPDFVEAYLATAELALTSRTSPWRRRRSGRPPRTPPRTRGSTTCWPAPLGRRRSRRRPRRRSPRPSRSTRATSTACCSRPTT